MKHGVHVRRAVIALFAAFCYMPWLCAQPGLEDPAICIRFDPENGSLLALEDKRVGRQVSGDTVIPLWVLTMENGRQIAPSDARRFESKKEPSRTRLTLSWSDFEADPKLVVQVEAGITTRDSSVVWRIRVDGLGGLSLRTVHFPRLLVAKQADETLAVPKWMGEVTRRARELLNPKDGRSGRWAWEYPGLLSLQCVALSGQDSGLRYSTNDTGHHWKQFAVFGDGHGGLGMEVVHAPAGQSGMDSYSPSYDTTTALFQGDWFSAADQYRAWAVQQPWVKESRRRREETPAWVLDTGLWVWNRGPSPGVLPPASALQDAAGVPVSVFWHWWHGCAYDAGFPEYLPPREGGEAFRIAVESAHAKGLHAIVYMNQRLWGMSTQSWKDKGAERFAVKRPDGSIAPEVYNTFMKVPCASMCMGTEFWRDTYASLAESAVRDYGVDGIYMDQACSSLACYDGSHGHPLGGGNWWMDGFRRLEGSIRERCAPVKAVTLTGEGCGEAWLPHLDAMLSLQVSMERYAAPGEWEPIPFFHAVYHDCAVFYGNYSSLTRPPYDNLWPREFAPERPLELLDRKFATQFRLEQARSFVWGQQPTVANFMPSHLDERREEMDFVLRLARLRLQMAKYLRDGVMLRPLVFDSPRKEIPMSRLSIYAGQQDAVKEYTKVVPMVYATAWKAEDGSLAVATANIGDEPANVTLHLARSEYPLPEKGYVERVTESERARVMEIGDGDAVLDVTMPPSDIAVYQFSRQ